MKMRLLALLLIVFPLNTIGSPISKDQYDKLTVAFEASSNKLNKFGTKRIVIHKVDSGELFRTGWITKHSYDGSVKQYFQEIGGLFEGKLAEYVDKGVIAMCFNNPLNSIPNINCTAVINKSFTISVYLAPESQQDFMKLIIDIMTELEKP